MKNILVFTATYNENEVLKLSQIVDPNSPGILIGGISGGIGNSVQIHQVNFDRAHFGLTLMQDYNGHWTDVS